MVSHRAPSDPVDPRTEALVVAEVREPALDPHEDVLKHVVDIAAGHAPLHERSERGLKLLHTEAGRVRLNHAFASGAQQLGPQQPPFAFGRTASMVADET